MSNDIRLYRKRPVEVEAAQFLPAEWDNGHELARWSGGEYLHDPYGEMNLIAIPTLEGTMHAAAGDWIIKGVKGELYPCKPEIFRLTYEAVESAASLSIPERTEEIPT